MRLPAKPVTLTPEYVRSILHYDAETGLFTWKAREDVPKEWNVRRAGKLAGRTKPNKLGYLEVAIDSRLYRAHRLAWFYVHGVWPVDQIDHINMDKQDNRLSNLREATNSQNGINSKVRRTNISGQKYVSVEKSRKNGSIVAYIVRVKNNRVDEIRGRFKTLDEAIARVSQVIPEVHGEFARF